MTAQPVRPAQISGLLERIAAERAAGGQASHDAGTARQAAAATWLAATTALEEQS